MHLILQMPNEGMVKVVFMTCVMTAKRVRVKRAASKQVHLAGIRFFCLGFFEAIAVSDAVNKVANTGPEIQKPGKATPPAPKKTEAKKPDSGQMDLF